MLLKYLFEITNYIIFWYRVIFASPKCYVLVMLEYLFEITIYIIFWYRVIFASPKCHVELEFDIG